MNVDPSKNYRQIVYLHFLLFKRSQYPDLCTPLYAVCPKSIGPFYIVNYFMKWSRLIVQCKYSIGEPKIYRKYVLHLLSCIDLRSPSTVCTKSLDLFHRVSYYKIWANTFGTDSIQWRTEIRILASFKQKKM